jgi:flagellar biosynthetic protein FlhB
VSGDKTEEPTPKKLQDARKKGQVAKSQDLSGAVLFIIGFGVLGATVTGVGIKMQEYFRTAFTQASRSEIEPAMLLNMMRDSVGFILGVLAPFLGVSFIMALFISYVQVGTLFTLHPLKPDLKKLNPISGIQNLFFKMRTYVELAKNMLKLTVASYLVYVSFKSSLTEIVLTTRLGPLETAKVVGGIVLSAGLKVAVFFLFVAVLDVLYQKYQHKKELKMSKDEVKREYKDSEGDPQHKAQRKQLHQEILENTMLQDVKTADAVVVNPDHIAAAIKYERDSMRAPRIIAKGRRVLAEKIKAIAKEHGVPILRNISLAQALNELEIGQEIPEDLYEAVAEVLNFVYKLSEEGKA